jgi:hypothetical protein
MMSKGRCESSPFGVFLLRRADASRRININMSEVRFGLWFARMFLRPVYSTTTATQCRA